MADRDDTLSRRSPVAGPNGAQVPASTTPSIDSLTRLAVGVVVIAALYFGRDVLVPITLAVLLSFVLSPLVALIRRTRLWKGPSVMLAVVLAIGVLASAATLIGEQAAQLATNAPTYAKVIERKVTGVQGFATARLAAVTQLMGPRPHRIQQLRREQRSQPTVVSATGQRLVPVEVHQPAATPLEMARSILSPVLGPLETAIIVIVVAIFVLLQKEDLRDRVIRLFGSTDLHRTTLALDDAGGRLSRYFVSQLAVNTSFGVIIATGLWFIGVPQPALWGALATLLRFVPYIGSFIAALAPIGLAAAVDPDWTTVLWTVALFAVVEPIIGYVVEPLLYGHSTGLSPISVVVAALFWTWIWGPIGLILSTPLTLCLVVLGRHVQSLEFFDVLLGDRPALSAVEVFYQRILTGNVDEALDQAEAYLQDHSLPDYFDEIVVPGLRLAVGDRARDTLDAEGQARIGRSITLLLADLGEADAKRPRRAAPHVVCIAGAGPFDEIIASMLIMLLGRQGMEVRQLGAAVASRESIDELDLSGVVHIAVAYLDINASLSPLRYLIRRLRARADALRILAGIGETGSGVYSDDQLQAAMGADGYHATLADYAAAMLRESDRAALAALIPPPAAPAAGRRS